MTTLERFLRNHPALNRSGPQTLTAAIWGGIAQEFDALQAEIDKITTQAVDINNLAGDELDEVIELFIGIPRMQNESDASRLKLLKAFFIREGVPSWTTAHSIRKVYRNWFEDRYIHIRENEIESDAELILDGGFESFEAGEKAAPFGEWTPSGSSIALDMAGTFEANRVLHGSGTGAVSTTKSVTAGCHILSSAYKGQFPVRVVRASDGKYFNFDTRAWQAGAASLVVPAAAEEYRVFEAAILADGSDDLTITFGPSADGAEWFIDLVSFGKKPGYPFVHVLVSTFVKSGDFMNAWPAGADPLAGKDYDQSTFFGMDFIGGEGSGIPTEYYSRILSYIKPAGVRAAFDFVGRV